MFILTRRFVCQAIALACLLLAVATSADPSDPAAVDLSVVGAGGSSPARVSKPHSFTGPYGGSVPFWQQGGTTAINDEYIHLTGTTASNTGSFWNSEPNLADDWEVEIGFKASGARYLGGDGFAFWYTAKRNTMGTTFGNEQAFVGLGILFDSYDNDNRRDNPTISAFRSDGTLVFDHEADGKGTRIEGASCRVNYRNTRDIARVRISYIAAKGSLKVSYDVKNNNYFQHCFEVSNLQLPNGYFFGVTAHTGDVADNHDIYHFHTRLLSPEHAASALHSDAHSEVHVESNQEKEENQEQGTEEVEQSVAERYHSSVLMWHSFSAKEKKTLRGEHVESVHDFREQQEQEKEQAGHQNQKGHSEDAGSDATSQVQLLHQVENAVHELRDLMFTTISEVRQLQKDFRASSGSAPAVPNPNQPLAARANADDPGVAASVARLQTAHDDGLRRVISAISDVETLVRNSNTDQRFSQEISSKLSLITNSLAKIPTQIDDRHAQVAEKHEDLKRHISETVPVSSRSGAADGSMLYYIELIAGICILVGAGFGLKKALGKKGKGGLPLGGDWHSD